MDCMQPMGQTSENVANDFNISRNLEDEYAAESYRRAEVAQKAGWFDDEIVPITVTLDQQRVTLTTDEGPRWGTTYEGLSKLRPAFPDYGNKSTAGNSCQITDGAAAILLMKRSKALELKQVSGFGYSPTLRFHVRNVTGLLTISFPLAAYSGEVRRRYCRWPRTKDHGYV